MNMLFYILLFAIGMKFGGFFGAIFMIWVGSILKRRFGPRLGIDTRPAAHKRQDIFLHTSFSVMGHMAKADGHVTEAEIHVATQLMDRMKLTGDTRRAAQVSFNQGKEADFPLEQTVRDFRRVSVLRRDLIKMFLEIQIQAAFADLELSNSERDILHRIGAILGVTTQDMDNLLRMMEAELRSHRHGNKVSREEALTNAYQQLGVTAEDDDKVIKRAYRKLMNEHHPDKLVSKGLPEEMMIIAKEKAQDIQGAYDVVKESRKMR